MNSNTDQMKQHSRWRMLLAIGAVYALMVGLMTMPAPLRLSRHLIGNNIDNWIFYWNNWWLERAIVEGQNWFHTPYLFFPQGASLVTHSNSFLNSLLALVLKPQVGPVAAYNLTFLFGLWASAVGMFLLVYDVTQRTAAGLVAGFVFAFAPYHLTQALAHPHLGSIHWWPFFALFLRRALLRHRIVDAVSAGFFAALTLWSGLQLAVLLALWAILYVSWHLAGSMGSRDEFRRSLLHVVAVAGLIVIVMLMLSAPVIIPILRDWRTLPSVVSAFDDSMNNQTDLLAYLTPPTYNPLVGTHMVPFYERFLANRAVMPYLGFTALLLALFSLRGRRMEAGFWLFGGCLWMVLAAGPAPRVNGTVYSSIPLLYRIIGQIFPIAILRLPDRFNLLVMFALAAAVGLGTAELAQRRRWLLIPVGILVLAEYLCAPLPMWDMPPSSPFFEQMAQDEARYAVLDYPMGYTLSKLWLYLQTLHGKPIVEGHISHYTPQVYSFITAQPLLLTLYQTAEWPPELPEHVFAGEATPVSALGSALRSLNAAGVRYVLLHEPYLDPARGDLFRRLLPIVPIYKDPILTVYDTARPLPVYYDGFPAFLTPDLALVRFDIQNDEQNRAWRFQVMSLPLALRDSPLTCQVQLVGNDGSISVSPISFSETPAGSEESWEPGDLELQEISTSLPQTLPRGTYHWAVACPGAATYIAQETLDVGADGHMTYLRRSTDISFGDSFQLLGYRWRTTGSDLRLMLWWKALQTPKADFKVFVHLLDANGEIVRQYDAVPCGWNCPTSQWQAGAIIPDQATLALWELPPGEYRFAIGLYSSETQKRLPARGPGGAPGADTYYIAPDVFVISPGQPEPDTFQGSHIETGP
jgi:hypothetical protein